MYVNIIYINKLLLFVWSTLKKEKEKKTLNQMMTQKLLIRVLFDIPDVSSNF